MNVLLSRLGNFCATYKSKTPYGVYSGEWVNNCIYVQYLHMHNYIHECSNRHFSVTITLPIDIPVFNVVTIITTGIPLPELFEAITVTL